MKNKELLNYTLGILLTLIVLTVVAGAGFRTGMMQNMTFTRDMNKAQAAFGHDNFGGSQQAMQVNSPRQALSNDRGFDRRDGGFSFLTPVFVVIRLAVLGLLAWIGYTFVKKSGWKFSFAKTPQTPVVEEEKASE